MTIRVRSYVEENDLDYFVDTEFHAAAEAGMISVGHDDQAARAEHREELLSFVDQASRTGILVAEDDGARVGLVWVSERTTGEAWDLKPSMAWIYDIRVDKMVRRRGLGSRLLRHAEEWARQAGYGMIGLHVIGSNSGARSLYAVNGYETLNTYQQASDLKDCGMAPSASEGLTMRLATPADDEVIEQLALAHFRSRARNTWPDSAEARVQDAYNAFEKAYAKSERDDVTVLVRSSSDDDRIVGIARAYASSGDLGSTSYVWLRDLVAENASEDARIERMLLGGVARWAMQRDLNVIRTSTHASESSTYDMLAALGFEDTNVFLRKALLGEDSQPSEMADYVRGRR